MDGKKLNSMRKKRGMRAFELAAKAGVTPAAIYQIESGQTVNPRIDTVQKLADALECDIGELLRDQT